jgi:hypothetical protein
MHRTATVSSSPVCPLDTRNADTESHPANAVATDNPGNPLHFGTEYRIPSGFEDNLPSPHTKYCGMVSQADTHLWPLRLGQLSFAKRKFSAHVLRH